MKNIDQYRAALVTGTPKVSTKGSFYLATPVGPSAKISLPEMFKQMSPEDLRHIKRLVDKELDRKTLFDLGSEQRGVEL